mgnify:CR=1 FL=1
MAVNICHSASLRVIYDDRRSYDWLASLGVAAFWASAVMATNARRRMVMIFLMGIHSVFVSVHDWQQYLTLRCLDTPNLAGAFDPYKEFGILMNYYVVEQLGEIDFFYVIIFDGLEILDNLVLAGLGLVVGYGHFLCLYVYCHVLYSGILG